MATNTCIDNVEEHTIGKNSCASRTYCQTVLKESETAKLELKYN